MRIARKEGIPVFAIGKNDEAALVARRFQIEAILDDSAKAGETWRGIRVLRPDEMPSESWVVNCSSSVAPRSAARRITILRPRATIDSYFDLCAADPESFPAPHFVKEMKEDLKKNPSKWAWLRSLLQEDKSQKVLADLITFRSTGDPAALSSYNVRLEQQYFEPFVDFGPGEVYVDCGGFDGDTAEGFIRRASGYRKIWFFEPSPSNMKKARQRLEKFPKIFFVQEALSDQPGFLKFNPDMGSASTVQCSGDFEVAVCTLDERVTDRVSFIKMDLEGWELLALKGAARRITADHPKLAIAVYHRAWDFWKVPKLILGLNPDYDVYLRHYTEGWSESVMYFIPRK